MNRRALLSTLLAPAFLIVGTVATADDQGLQKDGTLRSITLPAITVALKEAPGGELTGRMCGVCHSLDYITTQQKFSQARWQAEVAKMVKVYGAPIPDEDAPVIAGYIAKSYGTGD